MFLRLIRKRNGLKFPELFSPNLLGTLISRIIFKICIPHPLRQKMDSVISKKNSRIKVVWIKKLCGFVVKYEN